MAKVTLIMPPNTILGTPTMQPNLGVLYLAASLEQAKHEVHIADLRDAEEVDLDKIPEAEFYGFSATTAEIEDCKALARALRDGDPKCKTIVGGCHATYLPEDCTPHFDYVVRGEGEWAIVDIVEGKAKGGVVNHSVVDNLDSIPFPAWHLMEPNRVFTDTLFMGERHGQGPKSTAVISTRGCPFNCAFCGNWDRRIRFRSPENFVAEIKELVEQNVSAYKFVDDNFVLNKKRALKICRLLEPLGIRFRAHSRSEMFDLELAEALKRAGCEEFSFGVECADQKVLDLLNKRETVGQHERAIRIAKYAGLRVKTYFMVATPGETMESIELNKRFMRETQPDRWTISVFIPYPGSDCYANPQRYGIESMERDWKKYWLYQDESLISTDVASKEELTEHIREMRRYFLSEEWKHA